MTNPWNIETPFNAFFTDMIQLKGNRQNGIEFKTNAKACLFHIDEVDPFAEQDIDSKIRKINVLVKVDDIKQSIGFEPQIGDEITLEDSTIWSIADIQIEQDWYKIIGRTK